jgi:hypothetical protein
MNRLQHKVSGPRGHTTVSGVEVLTASGQTRSHTITIPDVPPREWFREPTDVTPQGALTITDEGRIFGYLAPADVPHRSFQNKRVTVPMRTVDYSKWLGGEALVADGRAVAGVITMNCGHASMNPNDWSYSHRQEHYDNTCSVVAKAAIGENKHGVWIAGALEPGVTAEQVSKMLGCRLSGDWKPHRRRSGWHEFVAALLVPVPGFAMGRSAPSTLVASAAPVRRTPAQEAQRRAAIDQVMRSQPPEVRAKFSSGRPAARKTAPRRLAAVPAIKPRVTDQLSPAWSATFTVGGWRQARPLGDVMAEARRRNLGHDPATEPLVAAYTTAMGAGDVRTADEAHGRLVSHVQGLLADDAQRQLDEIAIRSLGPVRGRAMIAARKRNRVLHDLAVQEFGPERVAQLGLKARMDRLRRPGGGSAA